MYGGKVKKGWEESEREILREIMKQEEIR